jgi:hypothetical protein
VQRVLAGIAIAAALAGCGTAALRPFRDRPIVWVDGDRRAFAPMPEPRPSRAVWDATDGVFFRRPVAALAVEAGRESVDVNALDEVPDSSWFTNRIGRSAMSPEEVARGACGDAPLAPRPWIAIAVKPEGAQPGIWIVDARGRRHLVKVDGAGRAERSTAADAIVAALLHAAGYHVPCNAIASIDRAEVGIGERVSAGDVARVLDHAARTPDGRLRVSVSGSLEGTALGPWAYEGVWESDPNDRVPHELRRELRALRAFFAWVDHVDARAHNTLSTWIEEGGGRGHVRHALVDFGDALGASSPVERRAARYGHAPWIDPGTAAADLATLGLLARPWYRERGDLHPVLGPFADEPFDPDAWSPNYWNGAFERADEADLAWAARIVARFSPLHLRAVAELGRFSSPETTDALVRGLARRRDAILERYLGRLAPLDRPSVVDGWLCLDDVAVLAGIRDPSDRIDAARAWMWPRRGPSAALETRREGARTCARLPRARGYLVVDAIAETPGRDRPGPARVHLAAAGSGARILGLERPVSRSEP